MSKYLINDKNGRVFVWTPALHRRPEMRLVGESEAKAAMRALEREVSAAVEANSSGDTARADIAPLEPVPLTADAILAMDDKVQIEAAARSHGLEVDRRKGIKTLQAELIEFLGLGEGDGE